VPNPQQALRVDAHRMLEQQIVVLRHGSMQAILNRQHRRIHALRQHRIDHLGRQAARHHLHRAQHLQRRHVAVRPALPLDRNATERLRSRGCPPFENIFLLLHPSPAPS
jgi:hypothetical protein